jgi:hypothetical protein
MFKILKSFQFLFLALMFCNESSFAQQKPQAKFTASTKNAFLTSDAVIENKGQYGELYKGQETMGKILFGYEGHSMPILFTPKGLIFLQRKVEGISKAAEKKLEKQGVPEEEIEHKKIVTDRVITMEWVGANPHPMLLQENKTTTYHTYGLLQEKAFGYKKLTYKNLYNGIDLVYHFFDTSTIGFEYSLVAQAGADLTQIKMRYGGDVQSVKIDKHGKLVVKTDIEGIAQSVPISFYGSEQLVTGKSNLGLGIRGATINPSTNPQPLTLNPQPSTPNPQSLIPNSQSPTQPIKTAYTLSNNDVSFTLQHYDSTLPITIDPFVSSTSNLNGLNAGKAKDVDFDYAGNVYVTGGGDGDTNHRLAKYNAAGVLQWTFNVVLAAQSWEFGIVMGGWVVEKQNGKIYLGQGYDDNGFRVIRLNTNGIYDNYITTANANFKENWKMAWNCNNGNPNILVFGGGYPQI